MTGFSLKKTFWCSIVTFLILNNLKLLFNNNTERKKKREILTLSALDSQMLSLHYWLVLNLARRLEVDLSQSIMVLGLFVHTASLLTMAFMHELTPYCWRTLDPLGTQLSDMLFDFSKKETSWSTSLSPGVCVAIHQYRHKKTVQLKRMPPES